MSEKSEDKPGSGEAPQLGRRLFVFRTAAVLGATASSMLGGPNEALAKDPGFGHQDPQGSYHVYDGAARRRYQDDSDNDPDDD